MFSIYFCDVYKQMAKGDILKFEIDKIYEFNTKIIKSYTPEINLNVGDVLIGKDFIIVTAYENIRFIITSYNWGNYLKLVCELVVESNFDQLLRIYMNNNNALMNHVSIETLNDEMTSLLDSLRSFRKIEVC
ncbi:KM727_gp75-like protein [Aratus pisonii nudivirus]|nr:KM727_gp75-like protein [Aratus pisonii nudivirus]